MIPSPTTRHEDLYVGMPLYDDVYVHGRSYVTDLTENSVQVFLPRIPSPPKLNPPRIGINCRGWFSTVQNNKGESDFNRRFKPLGAEQV